VSTVAVESGAVRDLAGRAALQGRIARLEDENAALYEEQQRLEDEQQRLEDERAAARGERAAAGRGGGVAPGRQAAGRPVLQGRPQACSQAYRAHSKQGLGRTLLVQDPAADQQAEGHEHHGLA
jgi:hypothetical protein